MFQSTPPRGGRPASWWGSAPCTRSFNPRPRAGGDMHSVVRRHQNENVSIHAPARGATWTTSTSRESYAMFQSTPPRGGRPLFAYILRPITTRFNPRPRAGGDPFAGEFQVDHVVFQSTPPRGGRRRWARPPRPGRPGFNPRPRAGGDLHRGGDQRPGSGGFNPRPRAGGDRID